MNWTNSGSNSVFSRSKVSLSGFVPSRPLLLIGRELVSLGDQSDPSVLISEPVLVLGKG